MTGAGLSWSIVVPVKRFAVAKTRLDVDPAVRGELALALAADTVAAVLAAELVERVVVVTDEPTAAAAARRLGATVVADEPDAGLNPALRFGASSALVLGGHAVAAVSADLPALRGPELDALLTLAAERASAVVADAAGTGTTVLTARDGAQLTPAFGLRSRDAHVDAGAHDLTDLAGVTLRRDVDTVDDLRSATAYGVGPATSEVLARHPGLLARQ